LTTTTVVAFAPVPRCRAGREHLLYAKRLADKLLFVVVVDVVVPAVDSTKSVNRRVSIAGFY